MLKINLAKIQDFADKHRNSDKGNSPGNNTLCKMQITLFSDYYSEITDSKMIADILDNLVETVKAQIEKKDEFKPTPTTLQAIFQTINTAQDEVKKQIRNIKNRVHVKNLISELNNCFFSAYLATMAHKIELK